jgi:hypothetical protein
MNGKHYLSLKKKTPLTKAGERISKRKQKVAETG